VTSKTEVTLQTEMTAHIMSSKTNTSAVKMYRVHEKWMWIIQWQKEKVWILIVYV